MIEPAWYVWASGEIGQHEQPENRGPVVRRYIALGHCGSEGDPWCAVFANAGIETAGFQGTRSALAQSFCHDANFRKLDGPALGAVAVFWRTSRHSGLGHVGFYCSETDGYVETLGGNEHDAVRKELLIKNGSHFGLLGYYWPIKAPLPILGRIAFHQIARNPMTGQPHVT